MRAEDIDKRKEAIDERSKILTEEREHNKQYRKHSKTKYFADGLAGKHPFLDLAETREEYLHRQAWFAEPVKHLVSELKGEAALLPEATGQRWDSLRPVRIGIIADRFLYDSLRDSATFVPITPKGYLEEIKGIDLLLLTSAWRGIDNEWQDLPLSNSASFQLLKTKVVPAVRAKGIPVVYYSKEDPPNYKKFTTIARLADRVYTSAADCIPQYRKLLRESTPVGTLQFAVNYRYHNPLGCMRHRGREFLFAGSWFRHKYSARRDGGQKIFDGIINTGQSLVLIDRNLRLEAEDSTGKTRYLFPERYLPHIHEPIDHEDLLQIQRLLPVGINLNSVIGSQTMFANRVVELQAMGTFIISNYNAGVNSQFPHVRTPDSSFDVAQILTELDEATIRESQIAGIRAAFSCNTAFDRIDQILSDLEIDCKKPDRTVYVHGLSDEQFIGFERKQISPVPLKLVSDEDVTNIRGGTGGDVLLYLNGNDQVGPYLVQDVVNAYKYADVDVVAVEPPTADGLYEYLDPAQVGFGISAVWVPQGVLLGDAQASASSAVKIATEMPHVSAGGDSQPSVPALSIIVPVYNNGPHLKFKCFESLRRSSVFEHAEILLIDDGSDDVETRWVLEQLEAKYPNVSVSRFEKGGSGSASRPRNKGLELAQAPYVTYLDPDNEQTNDGYSILLSSVREKEADFAIGNMVRWREKRNVVKNSAILKKVVDGDGFVDKAALSGIDYQPMSIQALVANKEWLSSLGIYQPVGAVGQDSYFFQQMLYYARKIEVSSKPIHTYYAAVADSTVNKVGPRFYEKYLPLEKDRSSWLRSVNLLEDYKKRRLERFVKGWFIHKLQYVAPEDYLRCRELIGELVAFYDVASWSDPEVREFFEEGSGE